MTALWLCTAASLAGALAACGGDDPCDREAPDTICTIAGSGERDFAGDGGPAAHAALDIPIDLAVSPDGELWILDFNHFRLRAIDARGTIRTVAGTGEIDDSPPDGVERIPAADASFSHASDLVFHDGYLYLAAWHNSRIKRVRLSDMTLENVAGRGRRTYYDGDGGPASAASLDLPAALAFDPNGELAVMDQGNQVIRRIDRGGTIRTIAGRCVVEFPDPCAVGQQPVACPASSKLTCGDPATTCGASCIPGFAGDGGPALAARLAQPFGAAAFPAGTMAYDAAGNLVFVDSDNHRIRKIDPTGTITTIAGAGGDAAGQGGYSGDDGPALAARLNHPRDLALAPDGTLYVTDTFNNCVRKIEPSGTIRRVAGQCGSDLASRGFTGDAGPPLLATLNRPMGLALDGDKLYISDSFNHRIRVVYLGR
jgi:hypothetical protein